MPSHVWFGELRGYMVWNMGVFIGLRVWEERDCLFGLDRMFSTEFRDVNSGLWIEDRIQ